MVDNCVPLDAENKFILDSEDRHQLRLTKNSLSKYCSSPKFTERGIAEMSQLTKKYSKSKAKVRRVVRIRLMDSVELHALSKFFYNLLFWPHVQCDY